MLVAFIAHYPVRVDGLRLVEVVPTGVWATAGICLAKRPGRRTLGNMMVCAGFAWAMTWIGTWDIGPSALIALAANSVFWFSISWGVLHFPDHMRTTWLEKRFLAFFYFAFSLTQVLTVVFSSPLSLGFHGDAWWLSTSLSGPSFKAIQNVSLGTNAIATTLFGLVVIRRVRHTNQIDRPAATIFIAGFLLVAVAATMVGTSTFYLATSEELILSISMSLVPLGFIVADIVSRRTHSDVTALLDSAFPASRISRQLLEQSLRSALGSPDLALYIWDSNEHAYFASAGSGPHDLAPGAAGLQFIRAPNGEPLGAIRLGPTTIDNSRVTDTALRHLTSALEAGHLQNQLERKVRELEQSRSRISRAQVEEQQRIGRDLHDGIQQRLLALSMRLAVTNQEDNVPLFERLSEIHNEIRAIEHEVRNIAHGLSPEGLRQFGLNVAIEELIARQSFDCSSTVTQERFSPTVETAAYFLISEALNNASKHSGATAVEIEVIVRNRQLLVYFTDNGIVPKDTHPGNGLLGMKDRVQGADGVFQALIEPGRPCVLEASLPLDPASRGPQR